MHEGENSLHIFKMAQARFFLRQQSLSSKLVSKSHASITPYHRVTKALLHKKPININHPRPTIGNHSKNIQVILNYHHAFIRMLISQHRVIHIISPIYKNPIYKKSNVTWHIQKPHLIKPNTAWHTSKAQGLTLLGISNLQSKAPIFILRG